ncbi:HIT family protein [Candidatus Kaiserbacteria bacterium]|nr:HIT family protein [Candidatus Kaiserbacteria bacterium]MCB9812316.1 HIT family protein [Candidatus Nomurabacteria bacterium]
MSTIFSKIINREIPGQFVYEDDVCVVLMDKFPSVPGQSLIIPKQEVNYAFDLDDETLSHLWHIAKQVALASDKVFNTVRTCVVLEGFEVPHAHIKLYPVTNPEGGLPKILASTEEVDNDTLEQQAQEIRAQL